MDEQTRTRLSRFLSYVLRHRPEAIGISLDAAGWVEIDTLLLQCRRHGKDLTREELATIVARCPKQRFSISEDGHRIRANQGHSVPVDLGYSPASPPPTLFHGTVANRLPSVRAEGLRRMNRHHVHLSPDAATARKVGGRRGSPLVLEIDSARMAEDGHVFFRSANGVWLTDSVPPQYLRFPETIGPG